MPWHLTTLNYDKKTYLKKKRQIRTIVRNYPKLRPQG